MLISFNCDICGKLKEVNNHKYNRSSKHYCSQQCAGKSRKGKRKVEYKIGNKKHQLTIDGEPQYINNFCKIRCKCDCGLSVMIPIHKFGIYKTCGNRPNHIGEANPRYKGHKFVCSSYWKQIKNAAKQRNIKFDISIDEIWDLFQQQQGKCALSGDNISLTKSRQQEITASLDRKNSDKGYTKDNVQWVHKDINKIKSNFSDQHFIVWCNKVGSYLGLVEKIDFNDVLIKPIKTSVESREQVDLFNKELNAIPIIASNIDTIGCFSVAKKLASLNIITCLHKHYQAEEYIAFLCQIDQSKIFYSIGARQEDFQKLIKVYEHTGILNICLDVANAYIPQIGDICFKVRDLIPKSVLMVGNIATPDIIEDFGKYGVSIAKCGIGSGKVCKTRDMTGIGIPQLSCILDCVPEAKKYGIKICSDGGCRYPADIVKAFAAGSSMVMIGGMLAGADECEGEWINNKKQLKFYGMSSKEAMQKYAGGVANYRASEGDCIYVDNQGPIEEIIKSILGGIRSACTYTNAKNLEELHQNAIFVRTRRYNG